MKHEAMDDLVFTSDPEATRPPFDKEDGPFMKSFMKPVIHSMKSMKSVKSILARCSRPSSHDLLTILVAVCALTIVACNSGSRPDNEESFGGGTSPTTPTSNAVRIPILTSVNFPSDTVGVGDEVVLVGINFSPRLSENVVSFRAGSTIIRGTPIAITFPPGGPLVSVACHCAIWSSQRKCGARGERRLCRCVWLCCGSHDYRF